MITKDILDEMDLPLTNPMEVLETISEYNFKPLFDPLQFEFCSKDYRDKGIDITYEIKKAGRHTGFRFVVQLKATESIKANKDGSFSLQLDTSNINYLLNTSSPAFYVLYCLQDKTFYYESVREILITLLTKDSEWTNQPSHKLRFSKPLVPGGILAMYAAAVESGLVQRNIREKSAIISNSLNKTDRISMYVNMEITDDSEIRKMIEVIGLDLINEGKWREVILVHKNATGNVATSALYNLVLGIANYYNGNRSDAMTFFKAANRLKAELSEELRTHLTYFDMTVKYSIGIINQDDYNKKMKELENTDAIGLYVKLENAKTTYIKSLNLNAAVRYEQFVKDVEDIINNPKANSNIKLNAKSELILFEGYKNNMDYIKGVSMINALEEEIGPNLSLRKDAALRFMDSNKKWYTNVQKLKEEAANTKDYFAYFIAVSNEVKVIYESDVYMGIILVVQELPGISTPEMPDSRPIFNSLLDKIDKVISYFKTIGHIDNVIASLSTKYEMLHYLKKMDEANEIINELENLIDSYDLIDQKQRLEHLKNEGTTHEVFQKVRENVFNTTVEIVKEHEELEAKMIKMDEDERGIPNKSADDNLNIHLFPIGYFQFPKDKKEKVYDILNIIQKEAREEFDKMFDLPVIPTANIYYSSITNEGLLDGHAADRSPEAWQNIYRIRKSFYENKFYRLEHIPGT